MEQTKSRGHAKSGYGSAGWAMRTLGFYLMLLVVLVSSAWVSLLSPRFDRFVYVAGEKSQPLAIHPYAFEVLDVTYEVVATGASVRVGPRFMYRFVHARSASYSSISDVAL